jgi:hypothetical protein
MAMGSMPSSPRRCSSHQSKKRLYCARVRHTRVAVADGRGNKFDETAAGAFTLSGDQHFESARTSAAV